jgi:hypothetical protein
MAVDGGKETTMSISFRKIHWILASAALLLLSVLTAGTWFR